MLQATAVFSSDYLDVLIRRWKWVASMTILGVAVAALLTLAAKPTFEATSVISVAPATLSVPTANQVPPYYLLVDSPRRLPIAFTPAYYVAVLKSAEVVGAVSPSVPVTIGPSSGDKSLIEITARGEDAAVVTATANKWAEVGVARIQQLLLPKGDEKAAAQSRLDTAEQELVRFSHENGLEYDLTRLRASPALSTEKKLELQRLLRERDVAESVYTDLAREFERMSLSAVGSYKPSALAAPQPTAPIAPKPAQNLVAGGAFGLLIGVLGAFGLESAGRGRKG
jgi:uncharacterized protein involved in exopolysaccharide biosynthesis